MILYRKIYEKVFFLWVWLNCEKNANNDFPKSKNKVSNAEKKDET